MSTHLSNTDDPDLAALVGSFNHMVDALRDRIQQDARFAADVSHELRTPVTTLTTSLSLLQNATDLSPRTAHAVELMADELARFRRALADLLMLGRLDAGAHENMPSVVGAGALVRQALLSSERSLDVLDPGSEEAPGPLVEVDRPQMVRALTNLFQNADLHGGGLTGVRVLDRGPFVDVHVEDRGPGVASPDRKRIFERFARAGGQKVGTGSGLGLSIVEQTARNHGGDVWCTDRTGGGARFVLRLPTIQGEAP
jgi:signal transduction histidine kinase